MSGTPAIGDVGYPPPPATVQAENWAPSVSVDGSEAMFSMYLERSDEDDTKTAERWKAESDAILIFVSNSLPLSPWLHVNIVVNGIDWSFLGRSRDSSYSFYPGPSAEFSGHHCILYREYLPYTRQYHYFPTDCPSLARRPTSIFSA
jgi:hypothetical protein